MGHLVIGSVGWSVRRSMDRSDVQSVIRPLGQVILSVGWSVNHWVSRWVGRSLVYWVIGSFGQSVSFAVCQFGIQISVRLVGKLSPNNYYKSNHGPA